MMNKMLSSVFICLCIVSATGHGQCDDVVRVDIASIQYTIKTVRAIRPAQIFTRQAINGYGPALIGIDTRFDSILNWFNCYEPSTVYLPDSLFASRPTDARICILITHSTGEIDVLWFGGSYTVLNNQIYRLDTVLLKRIATLLPEDQSVEIFHYMESHGFNRD